MKKLILLSVILLTSFCCAKAQTGGNVYTPFIPERYVAEPFRPSYDEVFPKASTTPSIRKISEDVITTTSYSIMEDCGYEAQVQQVDYSDGSRYWTLVGLKINGLWSPINLKVYYISDLLSSTTDDDTKSVLLECNQRATHIAIITNEDILYDIILIGLR